MSNQFLLATAAELRADLSQPSGKQDRFQKAALKRAVANMTVNNHQMLALLPEVLHCLKSQDVEIKRLCYLFLETYTKLRPQQASEIIGHLLREVSAESQPQVRGVALRTLSSVAGKADSEKVLHAINLCLKSESPYVRKVACVAVTKMWSVDSAEVETSGVLRRVNVMLAKERDASVVGSIVQTLLSITQTAQGMHFVVDLPVSLRLARMLDSAPDFSRVAILSGLMQFAPATAEDAQQLAALLQPSLRHINAAVVLGAVRVLMMLSHYSPALQLSVPEHIFPCLLALLSRPPEIQYCVLKNIHLLLQVLDSERVHAVGIDQQAFFLHKSDATYIKLTKIDILVDLCTPGNSRSILRELLAYVDRQHDSSSQKRALNGIGRVGARFEETALDCLRMLSDHLLEPEAVVAVVQLVRRYPDNEAVAQSAVKVLKGLEFPEDQEAIGAYLWFLGKFPLQMPQTSATFARLIEDFDILSGETILALLSACLRFYLQSSSAEELLRQVLSRSIDSMNPDTRDRALFYQSLLVQGPTHLAALVTSSFPAVNDTRPQLALRELEDLELSLGYLSSVFMRPADQLFRVAKSRQLQPSPAILPRTLKEEPEIREQPQRPNLRSRQNTLSDQFQNFYVSSPPPLREIDEGDVSERLIDF